MNLTTQKLEKLLKIKIHNKNLLLEALTHKSAEQKINNEKLDQIKKINSYYKKKSKNIQ